MPAEAGAPEPLAADLRPGYEASAKLAELWAGTVEGHAEIAERQQHFDEADRLRAVARAYQALARTLRHEAGTSTDITKPVITVKVCSNCGTAFPPLPEDG